MRRSRSLTDCVAWLAVGALAALGVPLDSLGGGAVASEGDDDAWEAILGDWEAATLAAAGSGGEGPDLFDELLRELAALRANPIDLNSAGLTELLRVPVLAPSDAATIVALRTELGSFGGLEDLAASGRIASGAVRALRPYVVVRPAPVRNTAAVRSPHVGVSWDVRLSASGRADPDDPWSAPSLAAAAVAPRARVRVGWGDAWRLGASFERDAGESRLLDHTAFHLSGASSGTRRGDGSSPRLAGVAGDIVADWAQGLVLSGARFPRLAALPRAADRVRGYDGAAENLARRGVHVAVARGRVAAQVLWARTSLDATIDGDGFASTIRTSGYHRTDAERAGEGVLTEVLLGSRVVIEPVERVGVGASFIRFRYDPELAHGDPERQHFRPAGPELVVASADVRLRGASWRLGAEFAGTSGGGRALLLAARARIGHATARLGCGHLSREFWSPLGRGVPGTSGGTNGIAGWVGAEYGSASSWRVWTEVIVAGHPWRTYGSELPPSSRRTTTAVEVPLEGVGRMTVEARVRRKTASGAGTEETSSTMAKATLRTSGRVPLVLFIVRESSGPVGTEEGTASAFGVRAGIPVGASSVATFGLTSVTERGDGGLIIQYEPSLPGEFALRSLNESGTRWYIRMVSGLSERAAVTIRLSGGPDPGTMQFGVSLEAKG